MTKKAMLIAAFSFLSIITPNMAYSCEQKVVIKSGTIGTLEPRDLGVNIEVARASDMLENGTAILFDKQTSGCIKNHQFNFYRYQIEAKGYPLPFWVREKDVLREGSSIH